MLDVRSPQHTLSSSFTIHLYRLLQVHLLMCTHMQCSLPLASLPSICLLYTSFNKESCSFIWLKYLNCLTLISFSKVLLNPSFCNTLIFVFFSCHDILSIHLPHNLFSKASVKGILYMHMFLWPCRPRERSWDSWFGSWLSVDHHENRDDRPERGAGGHSAGTTCVCGTAWARDLCEGEGNCQVSLTTSYDSFLLDCLKLCCFYWFCFF